MDPIRIQEINKLSQQYLKFENLEDIDQLNGKERVQILDILNKFFGIFYYTFQENKKKSDYQIPPKHSFVEREKSDTDYTRSRKIRKKKKSSSCSKEERSKLESDIIKEKTTDGSSIVLKSFLGFDAGDFDNMISKLPLNRIHNIKSLAESLYSIIREYQLSHFETRKICEHTLFLIKSGIKMINKIIKAYETREINNIYTVTDVENEFDNFSKSIKNLSDTFDVL